MTLEDPSTPEHLSIVPVLDAFRVSQEAGREAYAAWYDRRQQALDQLPSSGRLALSLDCAEIYLAIGDQETAEEMILDVGEALGDVSLSESERSRLQKRHFELSAFL